MSLDNRLKSVRALSKFRAPGPGLVLRVKRWCEMTEKRTMGSHNLDVALKVAEKQQEREMGSKISARMRRSLKENGSRDGARAVILSAVASENYSQALEELHRYLESRNDYPKFRARSERYLKYAGDLINAIRAKRSFPGMQNLSMSKQQDLYDRAMMHFEDLKATLRKSEQIAAEVKLEDVRSTVWVVKSLIYSVFAVLALCFLREVSRGVLPSAIVVFDDMFGLITNSIFDKLGF